MNEIHRIHVKIYHHKNKITQMKRFIVLAASALVALGLNSCCNGNKCENTASTEPSAMEVIKNRTSIRQFTDQPVEKEKIEALIKAGMSAPSAMNKQPWKFVVITNKEKLQQLSDSCGKPPVGKAALSIIVCGDMTKTSNTADDLWWTEDCGAATENILLAATAQGLGAVWCGTWPRYENINKIKEILSLPSNIIPYSTIAIGYPGETPQPKDKFTEDNVIRVE